MGRCIRLRSSVLTAFSLARFLLLIVRRNTVNIPYSASCHRCGEARKVECLGLPSSASLSIIRCMKAGRLSPRPWLLSCASAAPAGELHPLIFHGSLPYPRERTLHDGPVQCPVRVLPQRFPFGQTPSLHLLRHRRLAYFRLLSARRSHRLTSGGRAGLNQRTIHCFERLSKVSLGLDRIPPTLE